MIIEFLSNTARNIFDEGPLHMDYLKLIDETIQNLAKNIPEDQRRRGDIRVQYVFEQSTTFFQNKNFEKLCAVKY